MEVKNFFATNKDGKYLPSALVYIYDTGTTDLASGVRDISGNVLENPFTSKANGQIQFQAPNGVYDVRVLKGERDYTLVAVQCADIANVLEQTAGMLGPHTTAPATRNDGTALQVGDTYFNPNTAYSYNYTGAEWVTNNIVSADIANKADPTKGAALVGYDGTDVANVLNYERPITSYDELRAYKGTAKVVSLIDGPRTGRFRKAAETQGTYVDDGGVIIVGANGWVWLRINVGEVHVDWYLDKNWVRGVTDDAPSFAKATAYCSNRGGGTTRFFDKHLLDTAFSVPDWITLKGALDNPGELRFNNKFDYDAKRSQLIVNQSQTIKLQSGSSLTNALIMRKGLDLPFADATAAIAGVAAFAGVAVTAAGSDTEIDRLLVLGFDTIYKSDGFERPRADHIHGDCKNGIDFAAVYDIAYVDRVHLWPFTTTHQSFTTGAINSRSGTGFKFSNVGDWSKLTSCFTYGYARGFNVDGCNFVNILNCGTDHFGGNNANTSVGIEITGNSKMTTIIGFQAAAQGVAIRINNNVGGLDGTAAVTKVSESCFWDNKQKHIDVITGSLIFTNNSLWRSPIGVDVQSGAQATIDCNWFEDITTNAISSGTFDNLNIGPSNKFVRSVNNLGPRTVLDNGGTSIVQLSADSASGVVSQVRRARGTTAAKAALQLNDLLYSIEPYAYDGAAYRQCGSLRQQIATAVASNDLGTKWVFSTRNGSTVADQWQVDSDGGLKPVADAVKNLGAPSLRINNTYLAVAPTVGSDERYKTQICNISDVLLDACAELEWFCYKLIHAVDRKGEENARWHFGTSAQHLVEVFARHGIDANDYGFLCHDTWPAEPAVAEVLGEDGQILVPAREAVEAADRYSVRYEEALVLQAALAKRNEARAKEETASMREIIKGLEKRLSKLEGK